MLLSLILAFPERAFALSQRLCQLRQPAATEKQQDYRKNNDPLHWVQSAKKHQFRHLHNSFRLPYCVTKSSGMPTFSVSFVEKILPPRFICASEVSHDLPVYMH